MLMKKVGSAYRRNMGVINQKLEWKCSNALHESWWATPAKILAGQWCRHCAGRKVSLNDCESLATSHGGVLVSTKYKSSAAPLKWHCAKGHAFELSVDHVREGRWCAVCNKAEKFKKMMMVCHQLAANKKGKCLATEFKTKGQRMLWQCEAGHTWDASLDSIERGSWCPKCIGRLKSVSDMQKIALNNDVEFAGDSYLGSKIAHKWKCQCGNVGLAKIHQLKNKQWCVDCKNQEVKDLDQVLIQKVKARGGELLTLGLNSLHHMRTWKCGAGHQWEARGTSVLNQESWCSKCLLHDLKSMNLLAKKQGGKCLSKNYEGMSKPLLWQCANGHEWRRSPARVKVGSWCPTCEGNRKLSELSIIARNKGGECLSESYLGSSQLLNWQCGSNHSWSALPDTIFKGHWCSKCLGREKTMDDVQDVESLFNGECLSNEYVDNQTKMLWRCDKKHEFLSSFNSVQSGQWCPDCKKKGEAYIRKAFRR